MKPFPERLAPMLASSVGQPFDSANHLFEIKWDGIRCLALINPAGKLTLQSRNFNDITDKFPELHALPKNCHTGTIFDGELVVLDSQFKPDFSLIQRRIRANSPHTIISYSRQFPITYMVFDLLYRNNQELFHLPLSQRKELLLASLEEKQPWVISRSVESLGKAYATIVFGQGFEGVMAKDKGSPYLPGKRSEFWLKIKNRQQLVATIIGFTAAARATRIDALVLAKESPDGRLTYIGRAGTGFGHQEATKLLQLLVNNLRATPAVAVPAAEAETWWVKPVFKCRIEYLEFTKDGLLRHPTYRGLVQDE